MKDIRKIIYLGGFDYKIRIGNSEVQATEEEIIEFVKSVSHMIPNEVMQNIIQDGDYDSSDLFDDDDEYEEVRPYNTKAKILKLFNKYYDESKTKAEIFKRIANELGITFKAVEKSFYSK